MGNSDVLFETIFKRKLSATDNQAYFTQLAAAHPYFSIAQFCLLLQTQQESAEYNKQAAKTSLLFNNPFWLQFQLQDALSTKSDAIPVHLEKAAISEESVPKNSQPVKVKPDISANIPDKGPVTETTEKADLSKVTKSLHEATPPPAV